MIKDIIAKIYNLVICIREVISVIIKKWLYFILKVLALVAYLFP